MGPLWNFTWGWWTPKNWRNRNISDNFYGRTLQNIFGTFENPAEPLRKISTWLNNFDIHVYYLWSQILFEMCSGILSVACQVNTTEPHLWWINIDWGNGLVLLGTKPLPDPMMWWPRSLTPHSATRPQWVNSLWPSDVIWWQRSESTLARVMACCLTQQSHYLNQCWLIVSKVQWHSSEGNFTKDASAINHWN